MIRIYLNWIWKKIKIVNTNENDFEKYFKTYQEESPIALDKVKKE